MKFNDSVLQPLRYFKSNPLISAITSIFALAIVFLGFNQFNIKHLASPTCSTQSEIDSINQNKSSLEAQIAGVDAQIAENDNAIVSLQSSLVEKNTAINQIVIVSDYEMSSLKALVDSRYKAYLTAKANASKRGLSVSAKALLDKIAANAKTTYDNTLTDYNQKLATNNADKIKLTTLNSEKEQINLAVANADSKYVELNASRAGLQSQLDAIIASIGDAQINICPTTETSCGNGVDDDKDGTIDCGDGDCSTDASCTAITGCMNPCDSACTNYNPGDPSCNTGTVIDTGTGNETGVENTTTGTGTGNGYCTSDAECTSGQMCSSGGCVNKPVTTSSGVCNDEYDEYGWKFRFGWGGISITNNADNPCNTQASDCFADTGYTKDWNYNNFQDPGGWKCVKSDTNCKTGEKRKLEVICHPN